jgi:D-beta-D-heptose 7-phosphate kinase/D-beta-D-heptose 1-phosphate adenosyltransferase
MIGSKDGHEKAVRTTVRRLRQWPSKFRDKTVLVMGDLIVDEFVWGSVTRISPEAPVPVVKVTDRSLRMGGAANVVNNLRALGARVLVAGLVGTDEPGRWLLGELKRKGVPTGGILRDPRRPTSLKTRIIAHSQQIVRIDQEEPIPLSEDQTTSLCEYVRRSWGGIDGIVVSDYGKGVVGDRLMGVAREAVRERGLLVSVDPKNSRFALYRGVTAVTPNQHEAALAAGMTVSSEAILMEVGRKLLGELACEILLVTRGEEGMSLFLRNGGHLHIPTVARDVYDVTGAGDTVISTFTLGLAAGAPPAEAALLANLAAGIVVGEVGTAAVTNQRLRRILGSAGRSSPGA